MKRCLFAIVLSTLCFAHHLDAQSWQWVNRVGSGASNQNDRPDEQIFDMKVDRDGNTYACGRVTNSGFINNTQQYTSYGKYDIFVAKYNCHGDLKWYQTAGSADWGDEATGLLLDSAGNVILCGSVESRIQGSQCNFFGTLLGDVVDMFICKLDTAGNLLWYKTAGTPLTDLSSVGLENEI